MVSVITPVWNKSELTHQFLFRNWQLYNGRADVEFIIVDNGSTDNTPKVLAQWRDIMGERLKVVTLPENMGFGPGHNRGAQEAAGDILVHISNDVIPKGDYVSIITNAIEDNTLFGPQMLDYDTGWNKFDDVLIPYLAGWCLACNRATWDKLGGFDERLVPCDYEDIDLSYTAQQKGIELREIMLPLQHLFGQTAATLEGGRLQTTLKNQAIFKAKWNLK